ncbi:hypothetical protein GTA08_BOTSDO01640 [Neofusicoccum parvum]|uniref:Uncharacterized protein n=1 Tax=Neofusicoccum parvum TaxID=310453 RepID=A0ACB5S0U5_9PEZI|nr:hypothetical protein GTA08_BOTSDO01640 [Neofusicoccum parvum]
MVAWLSANHFGTTEIQPEISLLHYSDGIVSLHFDYSETELCYPGRDDDHWLIYVELGKFNPMTGAGVNVIKPPAGASKLFVRNTANYLLYGTHTGLGAHGHHEWKIHSHSLAGDDQPAPNTPALQLDEFVGSDIGSTVAFEIHDGYFYAVSNQTSFVVEEVDWTSFYHCLRFPLDRPVKEALQVNTRVYRRQHAEGPINDSWTDLSLQADEKTNRLQIVEARREWRNGGSKQERTFYTREVTFPNRSEIRRRGDDVNGAVADQDVDMQSASPTSALATAPSDATLEEDDGDEDDDAVGSASSQVPLLPADDLLVQTLSSGNNPHYAPEEERLPRSYHPERRHEDGLSNPTAFILARTKFRTYNLSCSAFFDLVEDDKCCPDVSAVGGPPCLRLRIGARRRSPFLPVPSAPDVCDDADEKGKGRASAVEEHGATVDLTQQQHLPPYEDRFVYPPIGMWPPPGKATDAALSPSSDDFGKEAAKRLCSHRLHGILNASPSPPAVPVACEHVAASVASSQETDALLSSPPSDPFSAFSQTSFSSALSLSSAASSTAAAAAYTPPPPATEILAAADERSIVFLRRPKYGSGERSGAIVLVSFDRGIEAETLAYRVGGGQQGQAAAATERKDSGIALGGELRVDTKLGDKEGGDQTMLWKRDWCWDRKCACVGKRAACGLA